MSLLRDKAIDDLLIGLKADKDVFSDKLRERVYSRLSEKSTSACLGLLTRTSMGAPETIYPATPSLDFIHKLYLFCRKKPYQNLALDSVLTDETIQIVVEFFEEFLEQKREDIQAAVVGAFLRHETVARRLAEALVENNASKLVHQKIRSMIVNEIMNHIIHNADDIADLVKAKAAKAGAIGAAKFGGIVASATTSAVNAAILAKIALLLSSKLKFLLAKLIASPAVKGIITLAVKKIVAAAVAIGLVKALALIGISAKGAVFIVLAPIFLAVLVREWIVFPKKIGKSVSEAVAGEVRSKFDSTMDEMIKGIFDQLLNEGMKELQTMILDDPDLREAVGRLRDLGEAAA